MIDLHIHSNASDGQYRPAELVEKACESGISVLAITDHDTIAGLPEAAAAAEKRRIILVQGIEIFVGWPTGEFHLLGLGFTHISPSLSELVAFLQKKRTERNLRIIEEMREADIDASYDELCALFPDSSIGRPHFAEYFGVCIALF
ncbi:MAG: PHP domain-containing protein [Treponema socranskii subsp. buccale]